MGLDGDGLARTSRLVAKVDSAAVRDGFDLYLHSFVVAADGTWVVVQQGMNPVGRQARRYHWLSEGLEDFVDAPHAAIDGPGQGVILNMTDRRAAPARRAQVELVQDDPDHVVDCLRKLQSTPRLTMPAHHDVRVSDVVMRRLRGNLAAAADRGPEHFAGLLLTPGIGGRTVEALALVAEVIHGAPARFSDPARFSLAHGGKDGHPFPVPLDVYDHTLKVLRDAVSAARLGNDEKLAAIQRLDSASRRLESSSAEELGFDGHMARERRRSPDLGGMTVFGPAGKPRKAVKRKGQLVLPGF